MRKCINFILKFNFTSFFQLKFNDATKSLTHHRHVLKNFQKNSSLIIFKASETNKKLALIKIYFIVISKKFIHESFYKIVKFDLKNSVLFNISNQQEQKNFDEENVDSKISHIFGCSSLFGMFNRCFELLVLCSWSERISHSIKGKLLETTMSRWL